jgi:hypothetical protein
MRGNATATDIEDAGDVLRLEQLRARRIVVAAQVQELRQNFRRERALLRALLRGLLQPVPADPAHLPVLELVVMPAHEARILPLPLPHRPGLQFRPPSTYVTPPSPPPHTNCCLDRDIDLLRSLNALPPSIPQPQLPSQTTPPPPPLALAIQITAPITPIASSPSRQSFLPFVFTTNSTTTQFK